MGEKIDRELETRLQGEGGKTDENTNARRTSNGRRSGGGKRGGATTPKDVGPKDSGLSILEPKPTKIEVPAATSDTKDKPKAKRGRPAGSKTKATAKKKENVVDHSQLSTLLLTITNIAASKDGLSMFALTQQECEQIAIPLSNILAKNESIGNAASEYADHIALAFAAFTILIPKILLFLQNRKQEKERQQYENYPRATNEPANVNNAGQTDTNIKQSDSTNRNTVTAKNDDPVFNGRLDDFLPTAF